MYKPKMEMRFLPSRGHALSKGPEEGKFFFLTFFSQYAGPSNSRNGRRYKKRAALSDRSAFRSRENYLRSLRRRTIAKAPKPNRLIVAGSGTGAVPTVK